MDLNIVRKSSLIQVGIVIFITIILYILITLYYSYKSDPYRYDFFPSQSSNSYSILPSALSFLNPSNYITFNQSGLRVQGNKFNGSNMINALPGISRNEKGGMEFSYTMFLYIDNYYDATKVASANSEQPLAHQSLILKKGNPATYTTDNVCPAFVVGPTSNSITVHMNTYTDPNFKITLDNLPIKKWFSLALVVQGKKINVYVNGFVKKSVMANSVIKQNYYPIVFGSSKYGGFNGEMTSGAYYRYALSSYQIRNLVNEGPNMTYHSGPTRTTAPYYKNTWWIAGQ